MPAARVMVGLRGADPQRVQNDLGILGIVLVPAVVQGFARAGQGHRRNQANLEAGFTQTPGNRPVTVACRLHGAGDRPAKILQQHDQPIVLGARVQDCNASPLLLAGVCRPSAP